MQILCIIFCFFHYFLLPLQRFLKMKEQFRHIFHSELAKNSATLLSANVLAQAIGLLVYPLLTRLYAPEDFGLLNLFLSVGAVLTLFATAEYQSAILLPRDERLSQAIVRLCWILLSVVTLVLALTIPCAPKIANIFHAEGLETVYVWLPVYVFFVGAWNIVNYSLTRAKLFSRISGYQITQSILSSLAKIGLGCMHITGGLVMATAVAPGVAIACWNKRTKTIIDIDDVKTVAREYRKFPLFSLPRSVVNSLSGNLPSFMLVPVFGLTELGYFGLAMTLAFRPLNMISGSLYQTFFQRMSQSFHEGEKMSAFFYRFIVYALLILCPSFAALYFFLPWLTGVLLGAGWEQTGVLIRVMLPWLAMSTIGATFAFVPDIFGKQHISAIIELVYLLLRVIALAFGIWMGSFYVAIMSYSLVGTFVIIGQLIWYNALLRKYDVGVSE